MTQVETDLVQYAESYYFSEQEPALSLAATLPYGLDLVAAGRQSASPAVHVAAGMLAEALDVIARRLDTEYLRTGGSTPEVLSAYEADQSHEGRGARQ